MPTLEITAIITDDPAFIVRDQRINGATVAEYAEAPERLPPVQVWRDPDTEQLYLLDGQHRLAAHQQRGLDDIAVTYFEGDRAEAEAQARVANLLHGLPLTGAERRRARMEVVERLYDYSNNWIAGDFLRCSSNTVAALRASLEEAGRIPRLERFKRKDGGTTPRSYSDDAGEGPDDGLFGSKRDIKPPADLMEVEPTPDNDDGGYNMDEDESGANDTTTGPPAERTMQQTAPHFSASEGTSGNSQPRQTTLKLAQVGDALALETTLYIDGEAYSVPVTLLIAKGPIAGAPETGPGHRNVLVVGAAAAEQMGLLVD